MERNSTYFILLKNLNKKKLGCQGLKHHEEVVCILLRNLVNSINIFRKLLGYLSLCGDITFFI